ncbi:MAG: ammonia-forming cytochrome c nitrite reductase subunit c552 [Candidatus Methanoperedens sp.]|uniref:ammonia-forming cytochrome c nitrite reductase subunit c552 n=1 Tax=Candidatus Methanoperedens sp. BLZ2 TaxID=2035255 RepID=UPI0015965243|nr:ammonia-forming cytochrome c nitrite reductase subunit c552 [Candidatus Methanoperedens sp. BLZ2]MBZ0174571.1 ammonia-forming cytochrome c nitrite reductase subunit c552 [Candidatus Methanoperedens nitroreducens]MCX9078596.1 ammonia-forming cytochrome c nitrite reductase subunit c552 [Candidatus Methanoperedens sp.]
MRKGIILGIGILIILLALAGTGSAKSGFTAGNCSYCHVDLNIDSTLTSQGNNFKDIHKFNGNAVPTNVSSCSTCHTNLATTFFPLTSNGSSYNSTHRFNSTMLASKLFAAPACGNCHVNANGNNFTLLTGTPTYLNSSVCEDCHKAKYDNWTNTMHRVMLTKNTSGAAMNLSLPDFDGLNWTNTNVSYMIVGKTSFRYLNATGYLFRKYNVLTGEFTPYNTTDPENRPQYSCGTCHTTGYNATGGNESNLSGIIGTWEEEGITCENCHGPGGNGHNVTVYTKGEDCIRCHYGDTRQGPAMTNKHALGPAEESTNPSCTQCHSPYNRYIGAPASTGDGTNITCSVCHNPHSTTDSQYGQILANNSFNATIMANLKDAKLSFFNGTASNVSKFNNTSVFTGTNASLVAGNDIFDNLSLITVLYPFLGSTSKIYNTQVIDDSYGTTGIDLTGRPESEVLCSQCHYRHGLEHIPGLNLSHGRNNVTNANETATCVDCHMSNAGGKKDHSFDAQEATNYPQYTCSKGTNCHVTSAENLNLSNISIVPVETEWAASRHNKTQFYKNDSYFANQTGFSSSGAPKRNNSECMKCHSPFEWNPSYIVRNVSDFRGITCAICHNVHDMGDSINESGLKYSWYNRDASYASGRYKANYTLMANTTELCGNCHSNDNPRIYRAGPGWNGTDATSTSATVYPISPHGWPAKDLFLTSPKESGQGFECIDCHMYVNKTNATGLASDTDKITGHTFRVNETGLQNTSRCNGCHDGLNHGGTIYSTIPDRIDTVQAATQAKWNSANSTVRGALAEYKNYTGVKNLSADKIARAYWNLKLVESDDSWGVHNPDKAITLLDEAVAYADASNASLGQALVSTVNLTAGWNLKALQNASAVTSPVSVMSSVASNITVVWGYNTSNPADPWELYDPAMPSSLNDLTQIVAGEGYWIYAIRDCVWTV